MNEITNKEDKLEENAKMNMWVMVDDKNMNGFQFSLICVSWVEAACVSNVIMIFVFDFHSKPALLLF